MMNRSKRLKLLSAAFSVALAFVGLAGGQGTGTTKTVQVQFKRGTTSAAYKGVVRGYNTTDYVLRANEGQKLSVKLTSANTALYFNVLDKDTMVALEADQPPREVTEWTGQLPKTGDYVIRVYLIRAEARRGRTANYSLDMSVMGASGSTGEAEPAAISAATSQVIYQCEPNVELRADFMQTEPPSVRIRFGTQDQTLNLAPSGSGSKYVGGRFTFWTKGDEAKLESSVLDANCKKKE